MRRNRSRRYAIGVSQLRCLSAVPANAPSNGAIAIKNEADSLVALVIQIEVIGEFSQSAKVC